MEISRTRKRKLDENAENQRKRSKETEEENEGSVGGEQTLAVAVS